MKGLFPFCTEWTEMGFNLCCGSMIFWCGSGSGSADSCLWLMDPNPDSDPDADPDPSIFIITFQDANNKQIFYKHFLHVTFWRYLGKDNQWIIPVCGRVLQWNFPFLLEKSFIGHVLTLSRSKKHFPCQEDFGPDTPRLWSGILHWVL